MHQRHATTPHPQLRIGVEKKKVAAYPASAVTLILSDMVKDGGEDLTVNASDRREILQVKRWRLEIAAARAKKLIPHIVEDRTGQLHLVILKSGEIPPHAEPAGPASTIA
jgi:hypothetical protein